MRKFNIFAVIVAILSVVLVGCNAYYQANNITAEEAHKRAVIKVTDYVENYVIKKIESSDKLSDKGKEDLKKEVAELKDSILKKIEELKAKYDAAKAAKQAAKSEVKAEIPASK